MTDKELLELAAKAAGYDVVAVGTAARPAYRFKGDIGNSQRCYFNPLTDDGDALRLAVKLHLTIDRSEIKPAAVVYCDYQDASFIQVIEPHNNDPYAAARRAIVRAAAEIGKEMK